MDSTNEAWAAPLPPETACVSRRRRVSWLPDRPPPALPGITRRQWICWVRPRLQLRGQHRCSTGFLHLPSGSGSSRLRVGCQEARCSFARDSWRGGWFRGFNGPRPQHLVVIFWQAAISWVSCWCPGGIPGHEGTRCESGAAPQRSARTTSARRTGPGRDWEAADSRQPAPCRPAREPEDLPARGRGLRARPRRPDRLGGR